MKTTWDKIKKLKVFYIAAFFATGYLSNKYLNTYLWLPFTVAIVGYIHVKYFHHL